mmetsp:Transcript_25985/g.29707  ORF Transcript_25985/g.29707 Transcript_25985/m.29707 type:complete len:288 (-) Transcript_25985:233-1096(-)
MLSMKITTILQLLVAAANTSHIYCFNHPSSFIASTSNYGLFKMSYSAMQYSSNENLSRSKMIQLRMSTNDDAPRKRRKRKDGKNVKSIQESSAEESEKKENEDTSPSATNVVSRSVLTSPLTPSKAVQVQVMDVRDVVAGVAPKQTQLSVEDDDEEYDDDDEYEYYYEDEDENEIVLGSGSKDSSLEALLADAKKMRKDEEESGNADEFSIPSAIRGVISTIVTVDFFVVCALLAWFLAGIFCSYVIKDDTVQIAFNGIFEPVVQPALGVLMIGSVTGAVFNEEEKE